MSGLTTLHLVQEALFAIEGKLIEYGGNRIKGMHVLNYIDKIKIPKSLSNSFIS